jgi:hypothetical protein
MEGQYIVKNLLIIGAALVVGGSMRTMRASEPVAQTLRRT